jgi:hypothetical protein
VITGALRAHQNLCAKTRRSAGAAQYALAAFAARTTALPRKPRSRPYRHAPDVGVLIAAASGQGDRAAALSALQNIEASEPASIVALLYAAVAQ